MIYWHVERKSLCHPFAAEIAIVLGGRLHDRGCAAPRCTDMEVDRQYVDSDGQSTLS
jgi:hypothetical protein